MSKNPYFLLMLISERQRLFYAIRNFRPRSSEGSYTNGVAIFQSTDWSVGGDFGGGGCAYTAAHQNPG